MLNVRSLILCALVVYVLGSMAIRWVWPWLRPRMGRWPLRWLVNGPTAPSRVLYSLAYAIWLPVGVGFGLVALPIVLLYGVGWVLVRLCLVLVGMVLWPIARRFGIKPPPGDQS